MYCPQCGTQNTNDAQKCFSCGYSLEIAPSIPPAPPAQPLQPGQSPPVQPQTVPQPQWVQQPYPQQQPQPYTQQPPLYGQPPQNPGSDAFSGIIPYKNSSALIAYYLAVFSLIPCAGLFLGIAAFFLGLQGLKFARTHPEAKGQVHAWIGVILGGLCGFGTLFLILWFMLSGAIRG